MERAATVALRGLPARRASGDTDLGQRMTTHGRRETSRNAPWISEIEGMQTSCRASATAADDPPRRSSRAIYCAAQ
jgi:hypothetical protein